MLFYYDMEDTLNHSDYEYWTMDEIKKIRLYPVSYETDKIAQSDDTSFWPVHDPTGYSWEHVECKDENEAYQYMLDSFNQSIYERIHDI